MKQKQILTKRTALELLSEQIRKPDIDAAGLIKCLNVYGKLAGWFDEQSSPSSDRDSIDKLVSAVEAKRKQEKQQ